MSFEIVIPEADVLKQISQYLRIKGYMHWRNNTGARAFDYTRKSDGRTSHNFFQWGKKGSGDIFGLTKEGKLFSIEVKRKGKKPTPEQYKFMTDIILSNGIAFVAYSVEDVIKNGL